MGSRVYGLGPLLTIEEVRVSTRFDLAITLVHVGHGSLLPTVVGHRSHQCGIWGSAVSILTTGGMSPAHRAAWKRLVEA